MLASQQQPNSDEKSCVKIWTKSIMTKWLRRVYINPKENISLGSNRNIKIEIKAFSLL